MASRFLTLVEVAQRLRRDANGPLTPRKLLSLREWLRRRGIRVQFNGLVNQDAFEQVLEREQRTRRGRAA